MSEQTDPALPKCGQPDIDRLAFHAAQVAHYFDQCLRYRLDGDRVLHAISQDNLVVARRNFIAARDALVSMLKP